MSWSVTTVNNGWLITLSIRTNILCRNHSTVMRVHRVQNRKAITTSYTRQCGPTGTQVNVDHARRPASSSVQSEPVGVCGPKQVVIPLIESTGIESLIIGNREGSRTCGVWSRSFVRECEDWGKYTTHGLFGDSRVRCRMVWDAVLVCRSFHVHLVQSGTIMYVPA